jgi:restriction endonuclease S subunit
LIPADWTLRPLGNIGKWFSGGTPTMSIAEYWSGDIPWVSPKDMKVPRLHDSIDHITPQAVADGARLLPAGAILVVIRGMILAHSVPVARAERTLAFNQDIKAVVAGNGVDSNFLLYWLTANEQRLRSLTTESTHGTKRLPTAMLFRELVTCPPMLEQEAIAEALGDADVVIESLETLLAKKRQIKQGAMQELLTGRTRLAGFKGKSGYRQSEAGEVPEDWEVKCVAEMGDVRAGKALAVRGAGPQRPYLRTKNVFDGRIDIGDVLQMPMTDAEFARYRLRHGDVLLNEGQSIELVGRSAMYRDEYPEPCAIQNQLVRFRARQGVSGSFAAHVFRRCQTSGIFSKIALQTTSVAHLGVSRFAKLPLPWPPSLAEQEAIAQALDDADAVIDSLEQLLSKKRQIQNGMMQELLTGRIRLV